MFKTLLNLSTPLTLKVTVSAVFMVWAYLNDFVCIDMTEFFLSPYTKVFLCWCSCLTFKKPHAFYPLKTLI